MNTKKLKLSSEFAPSYLNRFLAGEPTARTLFPAMVHDQLLGMAKALARDLPPDLHQDVVNETWCAILTHLTPFDAVSGTVRTYFRLEMRNAIKVVRASYAPAGAPKRDRAVKETLLKRPEVTVMPREARELMDVADAADTTAETQMVAVVLAKQLLAVAPANVAQGLRLVHQAECTVTEAAESMGMTRFTLARALERFCREQAEALVSEQRASGSCG